MSFVPQPDPIRAWLLAVVGLAATASPGRLSGQEVIHVGGRYPAGTVVLSPATGVGFRIPAGFTGHADPESGLFLLRGSGMTAAVWAYSQGSPSDVADVVLSDLDELGLSLTPDQVHIQETTMRASYDVWSEEGLGRLHGVVVQGPHGADYAVAVLGGRGEDEALVSALAAVSGSITWSAPDAPSWVAQAEGVVLTGGDESGTSVDQGDGTAGSFVRESTTELTLCRDHSYQWRSEGVSYFSSDAGSASSEHSDAHAGTWALTFDLVGGAWLILEPWDREERVFSVEISGEGVLLGGRAYVVSAAGC
ncbi:MAG: hypothetical protein R3E98_21670 [Gemmatimonadota bacterium]